jgi:hypothetical protein
MKSGEVTSKRGDDIIVVFMVIKIEINGEKAYL